MSENLDIVRYGALDGKRTSINCKSNVVVTRGDLGLGLFANRDIAAGEKILTFRGPIIDFDAAVAKGDKQCYPLQVSPERYIDLAEPGCYANHSCDPNAGIRILTLVALNTIREGVEVRYDYSTTMDENFFTMPCLCKSLSCRQEVTDFKDIDANVRRRYLEIGIVQPFIARQYDTSGQQRTDNGSRTIWRSSGTISLVAA